MELRAGLTFIAVPPVHAYLESLILEITLKNLL